MKKFFIFGLFLSLLSAPVFADSDIEYPVSNDLWDNWTTQSPLEPDVKAVSDEDFDKALEQVDNKVNKWKHRFEKWSKPKGEEFSQSNETEIIKTEHGQDASLPVICMSMEVYIGEDILPVGHYQVRGEKINGQPVLKLYQAHDEIAQFPAIETMDDFDEDIISFAKWEIFEDDKIKIMFGSMDLNAYAIVKIVNP